MTFITVLSTVKNIIPTVNPWLDSLLSQDFLDYNIIIIDSNSTDGTEIVLKEYEIKNDKIKVVSYSSSQPQALNYAINSNLVSGEFIALIDGDCVAPNNWLSILYETLINHSVDAVGGPGLTPPNVNFVQRIIGFDLDYRLLIIPEGYTMRHPNMNLFLKRAIFNKIQFNEDYEVAYDTVFCLHMRKNGYSIWYNPKAFVWHHHRSTILKYFRQQYKTAIFAVKLYFNHSYALKGDNINAKSMIVQPLLGFGILISLILSLLYNPFIWSVYIFTLILTSIFFVEIFRAYHIHRDIRVLYLFFLYLSRLLVWCVGAIVGSMKLFKDLALQCPV